MFRLSKRSRSRMEGVHSDLVDVVEFAITITPVDFMVTEGLRGIERQRELVKQGASKTMNSRHLTGHAVDLAALVDGKVRWDWPLYHQIAAAMKESASGMGVALEWGGDWTSFKDGPHFQLSHSKYPA